MKKILYYITDHGMGHATRSIAVIRELQNSNTKVIVRNENVKEFLKKSLPEIDVISGITDVGPIIKEDGISIDKDRTRTEIGNWISQLKKNSEIEYGRICKYSPDLIISDISAMPFLVSKMLKIPSIAISNFTWYDVLDNISAEQHYILKESYDNSELAIQLPLSTRMEHFKRKEKVGFVCRNPTSTKIEIKKKIGLKESESLIFFAIGKTKNEILCKIDNDIRIISSGTRIKDRGTMKVPIDMEGQDLVLAADLVICKVGYGLVSECLTCGTPFLYLADENHIEAKAMSEELFKRGYRNQVTFQELDSLDLTKDYIRSRKTPTKEKIETKVAVKYILETLNQ